MTRKQKPQQQRSTREQGIRLFGIPPEITIGRPPSPCGIYWEFWNDELRAWGRWGTIYTTQQAAQAGLVEATRQRQRPIPIKIPFCTGMGFVARTKSAVVTFPGLAEPNNMLFSGVEFLTYADAPPHWRERLRTQNLTLLRITRACGPTDTVKRLLVLIGLTQCSSQRAELRQNGATYEFDVYDLTGGRLDRQDGMTVLSEANLAISLRAVQHQNFPQIEYGPGLSIGHTAALARANFA